MALPTLSDLLSLDFNFEGAPFVSFAKSDPNALDYSFEGAPFWAQPSGGPVGTSATLRWDMDGTAPPSVLPSINFLMFM